MLTALVISPIVFGIIVYMIPNRYRWGNNLARVLVLLAQVILLVSSAYLVYLTRGGSITENIGGFTSVLGISLEVDSVSAVFILLTTLLFFVAAVYSFSHNVEKKKNDEADVKKKGRTGLFWFVFFVWQAALLGIFLTRDMFNVFVLMELSTIVVAVMIMYNRNDRSMYDGMIYLMMNIVAVQFYLFGLGYVYMLTGTLDMVAAAERLAYIDRTQYFLPYALIMTSLTFKCALMPMYSWLPKAHGTPGAPSAVSAILSGLHIKSGIYMLIRIGSIFPDVSTSQFFIVLGAVTAVAGIVFALSQIDIKLILAYSTIAQVGLIIISLNLGNAYGNIGGLYHVISHAIAKAALFLASGLLIHVFKNRDIRVMSGVFRRMPLVGVGMGLAILGITGAPLFGGSMSKYFMSSGSEGLLFWLFIIINLGTILVFFRFCGTLFSKVPKYKKLEPVRIDRLKSGAVFTLGLLCFVGGIWGEAIIQYLFNTYEIVNIGDYFGKAGIFLTSWIVGYFIYKKFFAADNRLDKIFVKLRGFEMGFRAACVSIGVYFGVFIIIVRILN